MKLIGFLILSALFFPVTAHAQNQNWLTNENVRAFLAQTEASYKLPYPEYLAFLKKSTHDDYQGKIMMTLNNGKDAPVRMPLSIDKKTILEKARESYDSVKGATITQTIDDIQISPDKKSATVKLTTVITNQRLLENENGSSALADMQSVSINEIVYTPMVGPQLFKEENKTDLTMKQEQEL